MIKLTEPREDEEPSPAMAEKEKVGAFNRFTDTVDECAADLVGVKSMSIDEAIVRCEKEFHPEVMGGEDVSVLHDLLMFYMAEHLTSESPSVKGIMAIDLVAEVAARRLSSSPLVNKQNAYAEVMGTADKDQLRHSLEEKLSGVKGKGVKWTE